VKRFTRPLALATAVTGALLLAACGGDGDGHDMDTPAGATSATAPVTPGGASSARVFNDADVMFAQMMIPHHEQAVEMAEEAPARAADPEVRKLAERIEAAQAPEIARMAGWLGAWGRPTAAPGGMGHGDGMMSDENMKRFEAATGAEFDRLFLEMMIAHHDGAIRMAEAELAGGVNPEARELAERIRTSQAAEVRLMRQLLGATASPGPSASAGMPGTHH
jgi:uncharacterized protein (DUF305 family)